MKTLKKNLRYVEFTDQLLFQHSKNMNQYTGGRWLIPGTKHHKDNRFDSSGIT